MKIPIIAWIVQGIPESIAVAFFVILVGTGKLLYRQILTIGLIQALIIYLVRLLPITPGVHTIVLITTLSVLTILIGKIELRRAIILSVVVVSLIVFFEFCFYFLISTLGILSFADMEKNLSLRILAGYPQIIFVFLMAYLLKNRFSRFLRQ